MAIERSAGANEIIYCGYPDNNRVSTDIGTGLNDLETELYYAGNRSYNSITDTVLRQEPKSRQATGVATRVLQRDPVGYRGGINLYGYVGGRVADETDPNGTEPANKQCCGAKSNSCGPDVTAKLIALAGIINHTWNSLSSWQKLSLAWFTTDPAMAPNAWDTSLVLKQARFLARSSYL